MIGLGIVVSAVAVFMLSSLYYLLATPVERRLVGPSVPERGRPGPWKAISELLRTAVLASALAYLLRQSDALDISRASALALICWIGFPVVLLSGSIIWEGVHPATATMHAGDWLLKLLLIAVILGVVH